MSDERCMLSPSLIDFLGAYEPQKPPVTLSVNPIYVVAVFAYQPRDGGYAAYRSEIAFGRYVIFVTTDIATTRAKLRGRPASDQPALPDTEYLFLHDPTEAA